VVASTVATLPPFQAEMVPFRLAKMKAAGLPFSTKDVVVLATWPVGPWGPAPVCGISTVRGTLLTSPAPVTE
jgi:hypothetical protein